MGWNKIGTAFVKARQKHEVLKCEGHFIGHFKEKTDKYGESKQEKCKRERQAGIL